MAISRSFPLRRVVALHAAPVVALVLVAVAALLPGDDLGPTTSDPRPARCVPPADLDHQDFAVGRAVWVLACGGPYGRRFEIPLPAGALVGPGAAALVASWQKQVFPPEFISCPAPTYPGVDVQVGFDDGTTAQVGVSGCQALVNPSSQQLRIDLGPVEFADQLATIIERRNDQGQRTYAPTRPQRECPREPSRPASLNIDGQSSRELDDAGALLDLSADESLVCRYVASRLMQSRHDLDPEQLLLASASGWYLRSPAHRSLAWGGRGHRLPRSDYVVTLRDKTDTWRTFTVTGRYGVVTFYRGHGSVERLGYASSPLLQALGLQLE